VDCGVWPELSLSEWGLELRAQLQGRRYPLSGTLEITERCNLACVHCFINQPAGCREAKERELSLDRITAILDQMAEAGCLSLLLTGGEVLLRPDFVDIYRHAKRVGMLVTVYTNGTLLTPRIADVLSELPPHVLEITLYGHSQETYERVTQVRGSYARCHRGIELALERRLQLALKAVVLADNRHELKQMAAFAASRTDIPFRYDGILWPRLDGGRQPYACGLTPQEVVALDRDDAERQQKWQELVERQNGGLVRAESVYTCGAGLHGFHIDAVGRMSPCMMARRPAYDLGQMSFREAWESLGAVRNKQRRLDTPCRTCTVGALCWQCPGWSQMAHGDDETPVEYVCEIGRLRAAELMSLDH
jgi:radical SAM protein with 4Fe4S-binding SPASM domain